MISPAVNELVKLNPPFEVVIQVAYILGDVKQKEALKFEFPEIIKEFYP